MSAVSAPRIHSLDNLKWAIVWLMVVFHAAMCYMAYAPEWWYVVDSAQPLFSATVFVCWVDIFIMPVMFFVSGYFGVMSLSRQGLVAFWKSKLRRIVLPWLLGVMMLAPFIAYLMLASRHSPVGFLEFYQTMFWGPYYQQAHYWYLGALCALYLLLCTASLLCPALLERQTPSFPHKCFCVGLFLFFAVTIGAVSLSMHPDTWTFYAYILVLQPVRVPSYIAVFFLGVHAWRARWFTEGGYVPAALPWALTFLVSSVLYLWQKIWLPAYGLPSSVLTLSNALCQAAFMLSALFFLTGFFHRWLNRTTPVLSALSSTSYGVYYLHQPVLFPIVWLFTLLPLNSVLKYLLVCVLTLGICFVLARVLMMHCSCFGPGKKVHARNLVVR